jgi:hypothetical protein
MGRRHDDDLRILAENLHPGSGGRGRRSPLFRWLYQRAEAFKRILETGQPSWDSVRTALIALDLRDAAGNPPTLRCVQNTWYAVKRAKGWTKPDRDQPVSIPAPVPSPTPARKPRAVEEDTEPPKYNFKPATLRNHVSSPPASAAPVRPKPQPVADPGRADRITQALLSGASKNPFRKDENED